MSTERARLRNSQLLDDQTGFDGLPQADVIRNQQVGAGHLHRPHQWIELVILDGDPATKRRLQRADVR